MCYEFDNGIEKLLAVSAFAFSRRRSCQISVILKVTSHFSKRFNRSTGGFAVTPHKKLGLFGQRHQDFAATPQLEKPKQNY